MSAEAHPGGALRAAAVVASLFLLLVAGPSSDYGLSIFVVPHERDFNVSRTEAASTISWRLTPEFWITGALSLVFARASPRTWVIVAAACCVAGYLACAWAERFWHVLGSLGCLVAVGNGVACKFLLLFSFSRSMCSGRRGRAGPLARGRDRS